MSNNKTKSLKKETLQKKGQSMMETPKQEQFKIKFSEQKIPTPKAIQPSNDIKESTKNSSVISNEEIAIQAHLKLTDESMLNDIIEDNSEEYQMEEIKEFQEKYSEDIFSM
jgi:hypothetical protein